MRGPLGAVQRKAQRTKRIVVISDSFKGSLSSIDICELAQQAFCDAVESVEIDSSSELIALPVADGGEGTIDCFAAALGERARIITVEVTGPFPDEKVLANYILTADGAAIIEMAQCAGLPLAEGRLNPGLATTLGVGEQMLDAIENGAKRIVIGLGGSATNDAGCGMAHALGAVFEDVEGNAFLPTGATLGRVKGINLSHLRKTLAGIEVVAMCDVDNPLFGPNGAAYVFAPQKGADPKMVKILDAGLRHIAPLLNECAGFDVASLPGAGAAGGLGAGIVAFAGGNAAGTLQPGIDVVLNTLNADELIKEADLVVTGEGKFDMQSLHGKVVSGVASLCAKHGVPVAVLVGKVDEEASFYVFSHPELGIVMLASISKPSETFEHAKAHAAENYARAFSKYIIPLIKCVTVPGTLSH